MNLGGHKIKIVTKPIFPVEKAAANLALCFARDLPRFHNMPGLGGATGPVAIIGGGPSLRGELDNLHTFPGPRIACGSVHDYLVENRITCEYAVFLDPDRMMADFLKRPQIGTCYLIASSCDPAVFDALGARKVLIWHPAMIDPETGKNVLDVRDEPVIQGGDGVVLRAWPLAAVMGYKDFHFYGFDCSFPLECEGQHAYDYKFADGAREEPIGVVVEHTGERFISCPGWIAQLQEFTRMVGLTRGKFELTIHGDSLAASSLCKGKMESSPKKFEEGIEALFRGDLASGFAGLEYRQGLRGTGIPLPGGKEWRGEDLRGKTILLHGEQGHGDMIMVMRYVPILVQCGADVVMTVHKSLRSLMARIGGVRVIGDDESWPPFDYWLGMMSLPHRFGTTLSSIIDQVPANDICIKNGIDKFRRIIGETKELKVGLCWSGGQHGVLAAAKAIPPENLLPLFDVSGAKFYSLQVPSDIVMAGSIADLAPHIKDSFLDTAHAIANLDLVITADTAVAHIAGTVRVPTWVMVPKGKVSWPWAHGNQWYPSARVFRQHDDEDDWTGVVSRVRDDLVNFGVGEKTIIRRRHLGFDIELDLAQYRDREMAEIIDRGVYEPEIVDLIQRVIRRGDFFVDVGANIGYFTLVAASLGAHVIAIEPTPETAIALRRNVEINGFGDMVRVVEAAAKDESGDAHLFFRDDHGGNALWSDGSCPSFVKIKTLRIDDLVAPSCHVRLMKVDAEGSEEHVLEGLGDVRPDYVTCELYEKALIVMGGDQMSMRNAMRGRGYDTFRMTFDHEPPRIVPPDRRIESRTIMNILFSTQAAVDDAWRVRAEAAE